MTRLGLARLLTRLHALLLLLHLVGIVRRIRIMLSAHHVPQLPRLAGHTHLLLPRLAVHTLHTLHTLLRQLGSHAHLIWSPAGDGVAHSVCKGEGIKE